MSAVRAMLAAATCFCAFASRARAQQPHLGITSETVQKFGTQTGRKLTFVCAPLKALGTVYGTEVYTTDSAVCTAAVHAGLITQDAGGVVTIVMLGERGRFTASARNGVTSREWEIRTTAFEFTKDAGGGQIDWATDAEGLAFAAKPLSVVCPPGGKAATAYGTDAYTSDSSICTAAVHAGVIDFAKGGPVTVVPDRTPKFAGIVRNAVKTMSYASESRSFRFASQQASVPPRSAAPFVVTVAPIAVVGERKPDAFVVRVDPPIRLQGTFVAPRPYVVRVPTITIEGPR